MKRLDNILVNSGYGSRREVQKLIRWKKVKVNGEIVTTPSIHVDPIKDEIYVLDKKVIYREFVYLMLNKPSGFVSAVQDKFDRTVLELINHEDKVLEPYPIGRLDKDTVGLLILSNDGNMCHRVLSPKLHVEKKYLVKVSSCLNFGHVERFNNGITLDDGYKCKSAKLEILDSSDEESTCEVILTEGKFHQVKRMFDALDMKVIYLKRIMFCNITLDNSLKEGEYRHLSEEEINLLKSI